MVLDLGLGFASEFHMDESEFEEGEDCYYMDNSRVDPDIALSYIDEKLQNVLGHFQKDFEGGVSAENLGTKFGGYGSFLPTYQRSPSIQSHPKNSKGVQNFSSPKSPNVLPVKGAPIAAAQSTGLGALNSAMAPSIGIFDKNGPRMSSDQAKKFLVNQEPVSSKHVNSFDQRTLKVRIKINSDNAAKNKAVIYSGFGLNTTPSSSMGNTEDSSGMPSQCAGTINVSPSNILQIMTSCHVPDGSLLSPLMGSLLCLEMKGNVLQISSPKAIKKVSKEKKRRVVVKKENAVISTGDVGMNLGDRTSMKPEVDVKVENTEIESLGQGSSFFGDMISNRMSKKVCDIVDNKKGADTAPRVCKEVERIVSRKEMEASKSDMEEMLSLGTVRVESLESVSDHNGGHLEKRDFQSSSIEKISESRSKNNCKDESVDITRNIQGIMNECYTMSKADSGVSNCSRDVKDEVKLPHGVEMSSIKGKKKSSRNQNSVDLVCEAEGSLICGSLDVPERKKKSGEVHNVKLQDDIKMVHGNCKLLQLKTTEELVKNRVHNLPEGSSSMSSRRGVEKKQGSSLNKLRDTSTQKDIKPQLISDSSLKETNNGSDLPLHVGLVSVVEPNIAEPIVIEEDWVQCDRCQKWRLLPYGTNAEQLPEKWVCRMLNWLPGMNRCEVSEDDTTQALHRLYQPESQINLANHVDGIFPGSSSAEMDYINPSSNYALNPRRVKPKLKETHCAATDGNSVLIPGSVKSFQQDMVKRRSLNDMNSKLSEEKKTHKHKEMHEKSGEKKLKSKREADQYEFGTPKRTRLDVASDALKIRKKVPSSVIVERELMKPGFSDMKIYDEREISLKKRKLKDWQESQNSEGVSIDDGNHRNERKELFIKEETCDNELRKIKSSEISNAEGNEFVPHKDDEKLRRIDKVIRLKNPVNDKEEALNRDLGSEHFSKPATSSSSKVSNSLKSKSHFLEVKGSPVESVSSSPIRNSNLEQLSPSRRGKLRKNARKNGHILMVDSSKKSLNVESNTEINHSGTVRKVKISGVSHSESPGIPPLDFRDSNKGQKIGRKSRVPDESPDKYRSVHLVKNEYGKLESLCHGDLQLLDRYHSDDKSDKHLINDSALFQEKSRKGSSLPSKGKDGSSGSNPERIKKVSVRPSEMLAKSKESLRDGLKTGSNDLKCRIKLVKDDKLTGKTLQQDQIQGINDGVAIKSDVTQKESKRGSTSQVVSSHVAKRNQQAQIPPSTSGSHKGDAFDVVPADSACCGDSSKVPKQFNNSLYNASSQSNAAFEKAEEHKVYGDRLKDSGFPAEGNHSHLQAVLYFLHAASLRESCVYDSNKHGEMSPMQIYSSTAKLCELCATEYEKRNDLATAALAYKCEEVAYLRVVYCKNFTMNRDRHDLQATLQIVPQGESPSSSASDVDSLNNQVMVDKAALTKSADPHAGNHIIVARNRPNFVRLLDFMKDVNYAMEASNKSQSTFSAAKVAQNDAAIVAVKRVIDLSFQDVDELIRLVRTALDLITRQGFSGKKDCK